MRFHSTLRGFFIKAPQEKSTWIGIGISIISSWCIYHYKHDLDFLIISIIRDPATKDQIILGIKFIFMGLIPVFGAWVKTKSDDCDKMNRSQKL